VAQFTGVKRTLLSDAKFLISVGQVLAGDISDLIPPARAAVPACGKTV
jgi:hypothetical protein